MPAEPPALRSIVPHAPTQLRLARSHARHEHETKPKPISRLGSAEPIIPPNLRYVYVIMYIQPVQPITYIFSICLFHRCSHLFSYFVSRFHCCLHILTFVNCFHNFHICFTRFTVFTHFLTFSHSIQCFVLFPRVPGGPPGVPWVPWGQFPEGSESF